LAATRKDVLEATLGDGVAHGHGHHERNAVALGHLGGGVGDGRVPAAGDQIDLFGVDEAFGLGDADGGVGLAVGVDQFELGPAQGFDAAGGVDLLHGHFPGLLALDADRGRGAGHGLDIADFDNFVSGPGRSRQQRGQEHGAQTTGQKRSPIPCFHATSPC